MDKQGAKLALLAAATTTAVVATIYLSYRQRSSSGVAPLSTPDPDPSTDAATDAPAVTGDRAGSRIGELRRKAHGVVGDLAAAQKRVTGEGQQVVARVRAGQGRPTLPRDWSGS